MAPGPVLRLSCDARIKVDHLNVSINVRQHSDDDREVERFFKESPLCRIFHEGDYLSVKLVEFKIRNERVIWLALPRQ